MTEGYLFSDVSENQGKNARRGRLPVKADKMSAALKQYAKAAAETQDLFALLTLGQGARYRELLQGNRCQR